MKLALPLLCASLALAQPAFEMFVIESAERPAGN